MTGTDGKTTTSTMIHSILKLATGGTTGYISTIAADIGGHELDTGFHVTTPNAPDVQRYLAQMVENGLTHCVLEMTSHGLAEGRLIGVDIDAAVVTNITHEHLDYHGSWDAYRDAKATMFHMLSTSQRKSGVRVHRALEARVTEQTVPKIAVINVDDKGARTLLDIPADARVTYGIENEADCRAENVVLRAGWRGVRGRRGEVQAAAVRGVQRVQRACRHRRDARAGRQLSEHLRRAGGRDRRLWPHAVDRRGPAVHGDGRLRPHAQRARKGAASRPHRDRRERPADRRVRQRRPA
ncbi:MAG: hypothetical protein HND48_00720 [Chloroflexi bacterium]|nr:hypothetical protein [Chloroflexota bacterium]